MNILGSLNKGDILAGKIAFNNVIQVYAIRDAIRSDSGQSF